MQKVEEIFLLDNSRSLIHFSSLQREQREHETIKRIIFFLRHRPTEWFRRPFKGLACLLWRQKKSQVYQIYCLLMLFFSREKEIFTKNYCCDAFSSSCYYSTQGNLPGIKCISFKDFLPTSLLFFSSSFVLIRNHHNSIADPMAIEIFLGISLETWVYGALEKSSVNLILDHQELHWRDTAKKCVNCVIFLISNKNIFLCTQNSILIINSAKLAR